MLLTSIQSGARHNLGKVLDADVVTLLLDVERIMMMINADTGEEI